MTMRKTIIRVTTSITAVIAAATNATFTIIKTSYYLNKKTTAAVNHNNKNS